jgi:DNA-binding transcriptional LysR family regulator
MATLYAGQCKHCTINMHDLHEEPGPGMNLRSIDLNLLVVLEALLEEANVSRAAARVGLSQSAASHALQRLRKLLDDDLLVRTSTGMERTARAAQLATPLREALQGLRLALAPETFDPSTAQGSFTFAVETYETIVVLPQLVDLVRRQAPGVDLTVRSGSVSEILAGLDQNKIDAAIGMFADLPDRFMTCRLLSDGHVCVMRADHALAGTPLSVADYLAAPHLLVSMSGATDDPVDAALASLGQKRRLAMRLPHGLAAMIALARSDMIATLTEGAAAAMTDSSAMSVSPLPFTVPRTEFRLVWTRSQQNSARHAWFRQKLVEISADADARRR